MSRHEVGDRLLHIGLPVSERARVEGKVRLFKIMERTEERAGQWEPL
jgi:hypothetical protein